MKKLFSLSAILFAALFSYHSSFAQIAGNAVTSGNNTFGNPGYITPPVNLAINNYSSANFSSLLEANVMINVKATSYVAIFSLTQFGKTVEEAETAMRARTDIFQNMLKQQGLGAQFIFTDPVSMVPTYETEVTEKKLSKTFNEVPTGFEMKKNVHVTFKEQNQINEIIALAAKAEVYDLVKVDYNIDDKDAILAQLRAEALRILMDKKQVMEKAGIRTRFSNVGEMQGEAFPAERYAQYYAYKAGLAPYYANAKKDRQGQPIPVQYNYAEKQKTSYYDKVTDKQFDKVINPVVNEPMVQIYFSLKGQFTIYDAEREEQDKAYNTRVREFQLKEMELNLELKRKELGLPNKSSVAKK
ncbi:SIMPL domain-containing protein [Ferruginibacter sp. HRS2-29]|uniref:SIMPL domain-containing protein n=1 Tax=Ferruginibacter sp. HRS2-29 TaxID=2487334 RepID=UPI0020CEB7A9|nr:SIMPL domain-containing protein [Ferruginibacter sp. HRS2-29]MCP9751141.1 DUF541 domain-containing protein [Ferruginibacter sp. HRS2-29]